MRLSFLKTNIKCPQLPVFKGGHFELRSLTWVSLWAIVVSKPIYWTAQRNQASEWAPNSIQVLGRDLISMARRVQVSAKPLPHSLSMELLI